MGYLEKKPGRFAGIEAALDWPRLWPAGAGPLAFGEAIRAGNVPGVADPRGVAASVSELVGLCHGLSFAAGWYCDPETASPVSNFSVPEKLALIHSEVSEALEADRKQLRDDKIPSRWGIEVELADAMIRILDLAGALDLDLGGSLRDKLLYNMARDDHTLVSRRGENGKSY